MEKTKKTKIREKSFLTRRKPQRDDEDVSEQTETEFFIRSDFAWVCVCVRE